MNISMKSAVKKKSEIKVNRERDRNKEINNVRNCSCKRRE
jgi:hypothetical protein